MKNYEVQIQATVTKTIKVEASSEEEAIEQAFELFTVACEEGQEERYEQEVLEVKESK